MADDPVFLSRQPASRGDASMLFVFIPCFLVLIAVAMLGQLVGVPWKSWLPGAENMGNVFSGVRSAVYTFMSHLS